MLRLFAAFNVLLYFSFAYLYLWQVGISPIKPLYWYAMSIVLGSLIIGFSTRVHVSGRRHFPVIVWALTYLFASGLSVLLISDGGPEAFQALIAEVEALLLLIVFTVIFQDKLAYKTAAHAVILVVVATVLINYADFASRGSLGFSTVAGRAAGMYENANSSGLFLVLGMTLSARVLPTKLRWLYCLFVATGVLVTFSRSSMMLWALAVLAMAWFNWFGLSRALSLLSVGVLLAVLATALTAGVWLQYLQATGVGKYLDKNTSARIGGSFFGQQDISSRDRAFVLQRGTEIFVDAPLLGHGIGATRTERYGVSAHNQYVQIAAEQGVVGLLLYCGLIWILWRAGSDTSRITALVYATSGFFTHNNLDIPAMQIALALAVSSAAWRRPGNQNNHMRVDDGWSRPAGQSHER